MSSDPKKPFDAPPESTPDLLQKELNLDRRRRVPSFDELQGLGADAPTDPARPAVPRAPAAAPQRPSNPAAPRAPAAPQATAQRPSNPAAARPPAPPPGPPTAAPALGETLPPTANHASPQQAAEAWNAEQARLRAAAQARAQALAQQQAEAARAQLQAQKQAAAQQQALKQAAAAPVVDLGDDDEEVPTRVSAQTQAAFLQAQAAARAEALARQQAAASHARLAPVDAQATDPIIPRPAPAAAHRENFDDRADEPVTRVDPRAKAIPVAQPAAATPAAMVEEALQRAVGLPAAPRPSTPAAQQRAPSAAPTAQPHAAATALHHPAAVSRAAATAPHAPAAAPATPSHAATTALHPPAAVTPAPAAPAPGVPARAATPAAVVARHEPPSPTAWAQARGAVPQVTAAPTAKGAAVPEGALPPAPAKAPVAPVARAAPPVVDEPEPSTLPDAPSAKTRARAAAATTAKPMTLPAELLVTQPGLPGPLSPAATHVQENPAIPERAPSVPELPAVASTGMTGAAPQFGTANFEEGVTDKESMVRAEPASLWRRVGAWFADFSFIGALALGFLFVAMQVIAPKNLSPVQQLTAVALPGAGLGVLLAFVYTTLFAFLWSGRTLGRRIFGIHLVDTTGHAPAPFRALVRALLSLVSFALCLSGFWLALFDRHGQTLHDKLTRTFVVKLQDA